MTKICFTPLLTHPQGVPGVSKIRTTKLKSTLVSWSAKIQPKKPIKIELKLSKKPCFLKVFQILFNNQFGSNLSTPTYQCGLPDFLTPLATLGNINSEDIIDLRLVFDIFVPQCHLANFFILFKLKPGMTCIDLISINSDNITF